MNAAQLVLAFPVRPCTPWCEKGDGHANEHPGDRRCWSDHGIVPLRRHDPMQLAGDTWQMAYLNIYLHRGAAEDATLVYVHSEDTDKELRLTLDEARTLRDHLSGLIATPRPLADLSHPNERPPHA